MTRFGRTFKNVFFAPLAAWLASTGLAGLAAHSLNLPVQDPMTWARWDSFSFLTIAVRGYYIFSDPKTLNGHTTFWSGNAGSFPLYSYLIRAFSHSPERMPGTAIIISSVFHFGALCVLWNGWVKRAPRFRAILLMAMAAVFPGMIYCHAISSVSLFIFLSLCFIYLAAHDRWGEASLAGLLAGTAHSTSVFLIPAMMLWMGSQWSWIRGRFLKALSVTLAPLLGAFAVVFIQRLQTGAWDSARRIWEFHRMAGGWTFLRLKQMLYIPTVSHPTATTKMAVILQSLSVAALCVIAIYGYYERTTAREREPRQAQDALIMIFVIVFWIAPHLSGYRHSFYRNEAYLLPILTLLGNVPSPVLTGMIVLWSVLAFIMAQQFFLGILI